tara:strand:- start:736 stop:1191 length:456 start_codon:yes stop_codon:yes gene_type:complete
METVKQKSCAGLVNQKYQNLENDLKEIKDYFDDFETLSEGEQIAKRKASEMCGYDYHYQDGFYDYLNDGYFLSWDFVEPFTFGDDQKAGYWRLQISYGGPSSEFRIYADSEKEIRKIEYWYLNWFDGAFVEVPHDSVSFYVCDMFLEYERF